MSRENDTHYTLPRQERLRGRSAVSQLFGEGHSGFVYPLRYIWCDRGDEAPNSVLFSVPKRFHKRANKRNLLRRRIKEAYRLNKPQQSSEEMIKSGLNIAIIYSSKEREEYPRIERALCRVLRQIQEECRDESNKTPEQQ